MAALLVSACCLLALAPRALAEPSADAMVHVAQNAPGLATPSSPLHLKIRESRETDSACSFPWIYSRGLKRCICTRDGYSLQQGDCLPYVVSTACADDERWSRKLRQCVCARALHREGGACVAMEPATATAAPTDVQPTESSILATPRAEAIARTQACFRELGYYNGPIDGVTNKDTWTAHWYFKREHGLIAHSDFLDETVQRKLSSLCKEEERQATPETGLDEVNQLAALSGENQSLADFDEGQPAPTHLGLDCLPGDLLSLLERSQGRSVAAHACTAACLPAPRGLSESALRDLEAQIGVTWCKACVAIKGRLALDDVQRIERAGNIELCATPPRQLPRYGHAGDAPETSHMRVRTFYRALPPAAEDDNAIALIIGNRNYTSLPVSQTSRTDADAIYALLTEHLGYLPDNIIDVRDTKRGDMERLFGAAPGVKGELARLVSAHPDAKVVVYYSGLGITSADQSETYLLPVDTLRYREERSGYPLSLFYTNLAALGAGPVLVLLEADFGRNHAPYLLPPNLPETMKSVLPPAPIPGVTVLTAADHGQRTLSDVNFGLGLFTRYLVEGLSGRADLVPIGNVDGKVDSVELFVYSAERVQLAARKSFGVLQNPAFSGGAPMILSGGKSLTANAN